MQQALDADREYLAKIADNVSRLRHAGLIRFASADTFSGEATYLRQYASGAFNSTFINWNPSEQAMAEAVVLTAAQRGMAVLGREALMKGELFAMAEDAGIADRALVARCALAWAISEPHLSSMVVGVASPEQLAAACAVLEAPRLNDEEQAALAAILASKRFQAHLIDRRSAFRP